MDGFLVQSFSEVYEEDGLVVFAKGLGKYIDEVTSSENMCYSHDLQILTIRRTESTDREVFEAVFHRI